MTDKNRFRVLHIGWGWMALLCVVLPFLGFIAQLLMLLVTMYGDVELTFPIMVLPIFGIVGVFLWWLWVVGERVNTIVLGSLKMENILFKKSMYLCTAIFVFSLIYLGTFDFFLEIDSIIPGWLSTILAFLLLLVMITVIAALIYCIYFVSTLLDLILKDKKQKTDWHHSISFFIKIIVFPIGIPIINEKIRELSKLTLS